MAKIDLFRPILSLEERQKKFGAKDTGSPKEWLDWVDYAKGIGIFLVVLGHVLRGLVNSSILTPSPLVNFIDRWMYAFHMPLFFFISGLFVQRSLSKPFRNFLSNKLRVIVYPYLIWSILQSLLQLLASKYTNQTLSIADIWKITYQPVMQFWFLYTLFAIYLVYGILSKLRVSPVMFLIISLGLYALYLGDVQIGTWGVLYSFRAYAIYFAIGVIVGTKFFRVLDKINTYILSLVSASGYLAIAIAVLLKPPAIGMPVVQLAVLGIAATLALSILLDRFKVASILKSWGQLSLEIYVAHSIASSVFRILLQKITGFSEPTAHILLGTLVGLYAPILLDVICKRIGFKYMFTLAPERRVNKSINA